MQRTSNLPQPTSPHLSLLQLVVRGFIRPARKSTACERFFWFSLPKVQRNSLNVARLYLRSPLHRCHTYIEEQHGGGRCRRRLLLTRWHSVVCTPSLCSLAFVECGHLPTFVPWLRPANLFSGQQFDGT